MPCAVMRTLAVNKMQKRLSPFRDAAEKNRFKKPEVARTLPQAYYTPTLFPARLFGACAEAWPPRSPSSRDAAAGHLYKIFSSRLSVDGDGGGGIDLSAACGKAMRLLAEGTRAREEVSASTGIRVQTVELIAGAMLRHGATEEGGWESLPDSVRFSAIKSECYPTPPKDAWIMARLMAEGATAPGTAVTLPVDREMRKLIGAGHVRRAGSRFYLAGIAPSLAQGVLSMYPELGRPAFSRSGGALRLARRLVGMTTDMAPPPTTIAKKAKRASRAMAHVRSVVFECHGYRGAASYERCRAVEEHVMARIEGECRIESVTMRELCVGGDVVQPTIEVMYSKGDYRKLIPRVDEALLEIGLVAAKALVSTVASHVASATAAAAGAGAGGLAGSAVGSRSSSGLGTAARPLAGTLLGVAVGALEGNAAEKRRLGFIGTKQSGEWHIKKFPRQSG